MKPHPLSDGLTLAMPDYGPYFERVIQALQQRPPWPPTWLVSLLAALVGGLFAVAAQLLRALYDERRKRILLVQMMHRELRKNFLTLYQFCPPGEGPIDPSFIEFGKEALGFFGQETLRKNPEIYLTMPEHWIVETLYFAFRRIGACQPQDVRGHVRNVLFLYAFNLLNQEPFRGAARKAISQEELDEVIPKAEAVLVDTPIAPFMLALIAVPAQERST